MYIYNAYFDYERSLGSTSAEHIRLIAKNKKHVTSYLRSNYTLRYLKELEIYRAERVDFPFRIPPRI